MTQNHVSGMEASAISVLKRAVELDQGSRFQESLVCYQEGIQLLMDVLKGLPLNQTNARTHTHSVISRGDQLNNQRHNYFSVSAAVKDDSKKVRYREKIKGYMDRAEQIKVHVNQLKEGNQRLIR